MFVILAKSGFKKLYNFYFVTKILYKFVFSFIGACLKQSNTGRTVWVSRGDIEVIHQGTSIDITLEILSFWQWYLLGETMGITKEI